MSTTAYVGNVWRVVGRFKNEAGAATAPSVAYVVITRPDGAVLTHSAGTAALEDSGGGAYVMRVLLTAQGLWKAAFHGESPDLATGVNATNVETIFAKAL